MDIKIGQVWQDKDKRRGTVIEIISVFDDDFGNHIAVGLVVGTEEEREYKVDRLIKRWTMLEDKSIKSKSLKEMPRLREKAPTKAKHKTREQWLEAAVNLLTKKLFEPAEFTVPAVRVSVGWPGGRGKKKGVVGQCFASVTAADKVAQIFVSPVSGDPVTVLATVAHELVHAIDDCKSGHKGDFIKIARKIGFEHAWTSSDNRSQDLSDKLETYAEKLGEYPHAVIRLEERPTVQKTYMLKVMCPEDDDYFVRMTQTKLDEYGAPKCPCHNEEMEVEEK